MSKILIGEYEATIYPEGAGYTGAISLGNDGRGRRQRIKRKGRTEKAVRDKLKEVVKELDAGVKASQTYTVTEAVNDWLTKGTRNLGASTVAGYRIMA